MNDDDRPHRHETDDDDSEMISVDMPVSVAQLIVGTLEVDKEIALAEGSEEDYEIFDEAQNWILRPLRDRQKSHFDELAEE